MSEERKARIARNKDIPLLREVGDVMLEIEALEKRRKWEKDRMYHITQQLSGSAGGGNAPCGYDEAFAAVADIEEKHRLMIKQYIRKINKASQLILDLPSQKMRTFVRMMYMDNETDVNVRKKLKMSRWAFDNARRAVEQAEDMQSVIWNDRYAERDFE